MVGGIYGSNSHADAATDWMLLVTPAIPNGGRCDGKKRVDAFTYLQRLFGGAVSAVSNRPAQAE